MSGRTILEMNSPVTQSREAVASLIAYFNHGKPPAEMPEFFRLTADMVLVRSNKGDSYYVVTPTACSCPSATYHPGKPCKHQRGYFPQPKKASGPANSGSIKPMGKWAGGHNGPVPLDMPGGDLLKQMEKQGYAMSFEADW